MKEPITDEIRLEAYWGAYFIMYGCDLKEANYTCVMLEDYIEKCCPRYDTDPAYPNLFPQFHTQIPERSIRELGWWPNSEQGRQNRLDALRMAIKITIDQLNNKSSSG